MKKDFIEITPNSSNGDKAITITASRNLGQERDMTFIVSGGVL